MALLAALGFALALAPAAWGDQKLTGVSRDGLFYRLDADVVCRVLKVSEDSTASGFPECRRLGPRERKALRLEPPQTGALPDGRRLEARLVGAGKGDQAPERRAAPVDPLFGKPRSPRDKRLAVVAVSKDGSEETLVYWAGHPEVVAVEDVFVSRDGKSIVVVYDYASDAEARVRVSAVAFRLP